MFVSFLLQQVWSVSLVLISEVQVGIFRVWVYLLRVYLCSSTFQIVASCLITLSVATSNWLKPHSGKFFPLIWKQQRKVYTSTWDDAFQSALSSCIWTSFKGWQLFSLHCPHMHFSFYQTTKPPSLSSILTFSEPELNTWACECLQQFSVVVSCGKGISPEPLCQAPYKVSFEHFNFIGILCSKFHLDNLKTMERVWDTNFHQQTDR